MKCEDAQTLLQEQQSENTSPESLRAKEHLESCRDCQDAMRAVVLLGLESRRDVPPPTERAFARAMKAAIRTEATQEPARTGFWPGAALGAALAASLVYAVVTLWPVAMPTGATSTTTSTPTVYLMPAEVKQVAIAVHSETPISGAEIHVSLSGAIGLEGFAGQRELRWLTELDRGVNQLNLPIVALGEAGGQIMVDVLSGAQRKSFLFDVRTLAAEPNAG